MDWDDAKQLYAEMDQAYFDAIGCSVCTWDSVDWDNIIGTRLIGMLMMKHITKFYLTML